MQDVEYVNHQSPPHVKNSTGDMNDTHNSIFFAAVSTTRMPIILTDPNQDDNPIVFANEAFVKMTGYESHELIGRNCRFLQGPDTDRFLVSQIRQAIEEKREISVEILNYKKNRSSFWNALFISPVFDQDDNLIYFFASQLDVTRRVDAESALRQSQKMEAVGQLTGGIAHDFNNLLTVVLGFSEILDAKLKSDNFDKDRAQRSLNAIIQAAQKGTKLTSQLLSFARRQKLEGRIINLTDLIVQLTPLIEKSVGDGVVVKINKSDHKGNVRLDPVQAELAIINIAVNARDAMSGNGILTIDLSSRYIDYRDSIFTNIEPGLYNCLSITDTGTGMDPDVLERITEPFFTTKSEGKGTGLGMSMVYGFVNQANGFMRVKSTIGEGTSIHIAFRCENLEIEPVVIKANKQIEGRKGDRETILVVEDKVDVGDYAEEVLSEFGYTVIRAGNADEALKILANKIDIDVLFSDIVMPGSQNGGQLAREVATRYPKMKILLTTGYSAESINIDDPYGKQFDLLNKPYRRVELVERIRMTIDGPNGIS